MTDYGGIAHVIEPLNSHVAHADDDEDDGNYELQVRASYHRDLVTHYHSLIHSLVH